MIAAPLNTALCSHLNLDTAAARRGQLGDRQSRYQSLEGQQGVTDWLHAEIAAFDRGDIGCIEPVAHFPIGNGLYLVQPAVTQFQRDIEEAAGISAITRVTNGYFLCFIANKTKPENVAL